MKNNSRWQGTMSETNTSRQQQTNIWMRTHNENTEHEMRTLLEMRNVVLWRTICAIVFPISLYHVDKLFLIILLYHDFSDRMTYSIIISYHIILSIECLLHINNRLYCMIYPSFMTKEVMMLSSQSAFGFRAKKTRYTAVHYTVQ